MYSFAFSASRNSCPYPFQEVCPGQCQDRHISVQGKRRRTANSRFDSYVRLPERDQHWPRAEGPLGDAHADGKEHIQAPGGAAWQAPHPQQQFRPPDAYRLDGEDSGDSYEDTDSDDTPERKPLKGVTCCAVLGWHGSSEATAGEQVFPSTHQDHPGGQLLYLVSCG